MGLWGTLGKGVAPVRTQHLLYGVIGFYGSTLLVSAPLSCGLSPGHAPVQCSLFPPESPGVQAQASESPGQGQGGCPGYSSVDSDT